MQLFISLWLDLVTLLHDHSGLQEFFGRFTHDHKNYTLFSNFLSVSDTEEIYAMMYFSVCQQNSDSSTLWVRVGS